MRPLVQYGQPNLDSNLISCILVSIFAFREARRMASATEMMARPFVKLKDACALLRQRSVELQITVENIGTVPILITTLRVNTISNADQVLGHEYGIPDNLLYPGDVRQWTVKSVRSFSLQGSNAHMNYNQSQPSTFTWIINYQVADSSGPVYASSVLFPKLAWQCHPTA